MIDLVLKKVQQYRKQEDGIGTVSSLFFLVLIAIIGGIALDGANAWRARFQLQVAADAAALAAAAHIDNPTAAREIAMEVVRRNLGGDTNALTSEDITFGVWDAASGDFALAEDESAEDAYDAVVVQTQRSNERSNSVGTYLMRLIGIDSFEVAAYSIARSDIQTGTETIEISGGGTSAHCSAATFISTHSVSAGGGNDFHDGVCIYGAGSVAFGGNDYFDDTVRLMANDIATIRDSHVASGSATVPEIASEGYLEAAIVPNLDWMFSERWNAFYGKHGQNYGGDLVPDFIKDPATGTAKIVQYDGWWSIQPSQVQPYTIYVVNGGAQFSGGIDAQNVMFMVNGYFGVGGGGSLHFKDVYFFGTDVNLAGSVQWGDPSITCDDHRYSVYLFAKNYVSLGGWAAPVPMDGVVVAAPSIRPGGSMTATHVYFESTQNFNIGGDFSVWGCANGYEGPMNSHWELTSAGGPSTSTETVEYVVRKATLKQ
ncbi:pilus assembly protein TadG-related protein [Celeribacter arenosi]|uniref:Putative Flp pilus-assembly TadG-like N-terminal domain-containing protein n=1 Tax=Celeribacter arenosi TaxID=792649 RepID=A0ABP7KET1_9RHOB